jgi:DNA polymerase III epsilon subunit family exonuclease
MLYKSLEEVDFAFLDVETTGLDPYWGDRICEIAILKTRGGRVLDRFETLINPGRTIPYQAMAVNGITNEMVRNAPFFRDVARDVLISLRDAVIVAHNAPFDLGFLTAEFSNIRLSPPQGEVVDTLSIARRYYNFPSNNLGRIARHLGIPTFGEHRAFGDVRITRDVFEFFLMDLERRGMRIKHLKDVLKLQGEKVSFEVSDEIVIPPTIEEALRIRGKLRIRYLSAYREATTTRIIEPIEVRVSRGHTYLIAYCHLRKERCSFRLDRILEVRSVS